MSKHNGRLTRLEERLPRGCPTCRAWEAGAVRVSVQDDDVEPLHPEGCPACGRPVPRHRIVIGTRPDGPA